MNLNFTDTLDAAWAEAEAALPEGWELASIDHILDVWQASAEPQSAYRNAVLRRESDGYEPGLLAVPPRRASSGPTS